MKTATRFWTAAVALGVIISSSPSHAQTVMTKEKLVGSWQLVFFNSASGNEVTYPLGEHPGGYVGFTGTRFWVMLTDSTRKPPAANAFSDAEAVYLMKTHAAYTGTYTTDSTQTPDGIKTTIRVDAASNQALLGTDRTFFMRVDGDKLTIKSNTTRNAITGLITNVRLDFVKAE